MPRTTWSRCSATRASPPPADDIADIATDPHYRERGTLVTVEDPDFGALPMPAPMPRLSKTAGAVTHPGARVLIRHLS
ncbi:CoA transferase [Streptomyces sp. AcE210]|uniref:CoA transferase n=1 Tax=Streptomyces sp. AcE210 TaxID=2292703 RepID=UPI000E30198C|nr:CoA transferase [Streptomyces sp. AcE210]RFC77458.1 hypothetical protein DXZ75_05995 [Streptomyces sp. AcE210]